MLLINIPPREDKDSVTIDYDLFWIVNGIRFDLNWDWCIFLCIFGKDFIGLKDDHFFDLLTWDHPKWMAWSYNLDIFVVGDLKVVFVWFSLCILKEEYVGIFDSSIWLYFVELAGSIDVKEHMLFFASHVKECHEGDGKHHDIGDDTKPKDSCLLTAL